MKLNEIYRSILKFAGLDADSDGYIFTVLEDRRDPALVNGVRLVLPTDQQLKTANPKEKMVFHPLSENILRGESEVIAKLREVINIRLNFTFGIVAQSLLNLIASPDLHHKLTPDQSDLLIAVKDVDETSVKNLISVSMAGIKSRADRLFVGIYLKRGGSVHGKRHGRVGVVSFPLLEDIDKEEGTLLGVKVRVKDKKAIRELYNFIFPTVEQPESYNYGSDSNTAPYLDTLMNTAMNIASRLNDIIIEFSDYIDEHERLMFESGWVEHFENLDVLIPEIRRIPVQMGNEGSAKQPEQEQPVQASLPVPVVQQVVQPVVQNQQQLYTQGVQMQQPQMYVQPKPELKQTKRGLDFNSLKSVNPAIGFVPNPLMPQLMQQQQQQQMMQMQAPPRWATPTNNMNTGFVNQGYGGGMQFGQPVLNTVYNV